MGKTAHGAEKGTSLRSLNRVNLIGNVGADPDVRSTASGTRVAKLSLATSRQFTDRSGQQQERTQWHRCTFFGKLVDVVESWVAKGDRLYIDGRIEYSQTQADDGTTRYWTDIIVNEMIMLGSDKKGGQKQGRGGQGDRRRGQQQSSQPSKPKKPITEPDDDLPFVLVPFLFTATEIMSAFPF